MSTADVVKSRGLCLAGTPWCVFGLVHTYGAFHMQPSVREILLSNLGDLSSNFLQVQAILPELPEHKASGVRHADEQLHIG